MRRVRLPNGRYGFVGSSQDAVGDKGAITESASLTSLINQAAANGDLDEVERLQNIVQKQADKRIWRPF
jgi:hypothetical protein